MYCYFDCFSGASGDMLVGSLLDAGASITELQSLVESLKLDVAVRCARQTVQGISCTKFMVEPGQVQPLRHLPQIMDIIATSSAPDLIKDKAGHIFLHLAQAEATVHGIPVEKVHFHEIGAVDTIIDVMAVLFCLNELGVDKIYSSPLPWNSGWVNISHGKYPLPAPATALLLNGIPVVGSSCTQELVTPTGAAILAGVCQSFSFPPLVPKKIGYGAGDLVRSDDVPNLLRVIIGEEYAISAQGQELIGVIETQIDDMNPEFYSYLYKSVQDDSAIIDLFTTPVYMKKNRPGVLITLLVRPHDIKRVAEWLLANTTTLGVRTRVDNRYMVNRRTVAINTPWGTVEVKIAQLPDGTIRTKPEYEDCQSIALQNNLSLTKVYDEVERIIRSSSFA
jgi:uncharacterized protein (TIGR00299 family) protein